MKLLLVHLSDLHIRTGEDPILSRIERIVEAVQNLDHQVNAVVIAVSGDLAFGGSADQYDAVWQFLLDLAAHLRDALSSVEREASLPVHIVAVPGNHDCDFSNPRELRGALIPVVLQKPELALDSEVVSTCTQVQDTFFDYLDVYATDEAVPASPLYDRRLACRYDISVGDKTARFLCLNTAWLSERHEQQAHLYFPPGAIQSDGQVDVAVAMFHHPYNWTEADTGRSFRKQVEAAADIILTGHEHDATIRSQQVSTGERNTYIEGGALQGSSNSSESAFNVFLLDLASRKQKMTQFEWNGERYTKLGASAPAGDSFGLVWEDFQVTRLRGSDRFELSVTTQEWLEELGMNLVQQSCGPLRLSDVFVFPDLQEVLYPMRKNGRTVRGEKVLDLVAEVPQLILMGDSKSGKTCLARVLFRYLHRGGYVPIHLSGVGKLPLGEHLDTHIVKRFQEQYHSADPESYRQLDRSRRVVIVDDFDRLQLSPKDRHKLVERLEDFAGRVVLLVNSPNFEVTELLHPEGRAEIVAPFTAYRILPFGYLRRGELVDKWLSLSGADVDPVATAYQHSFLMRTMNGLIGKNFLPPYPFAILAVLQAHEAGMPAATQMSTYGAYYELLIRTAMAHGRTPAAWDTDLNYLAHFAYCLFKDRRMEADEERFLQIDKEFKERFEIRRNAEALRGDLVKCNILTVSGDVTRFRYKYIYYYFVAQWMRDHITEEPIRSEIQKLSRLLYIEECANILLFLAHLCKDPFIVGELLAAADTQFLGTTPAAFADDVKFLFNISLPREQVQYEDTNVTESRNHYLATLDKVEAHTPEEEHSLYLDIPDGDPSAQAINLINKFNAALKTVDILGQMLKNFPGSLEGDVKLRIAQSCFSLGLRAVSSVFESLHKNEAEVITHLCAAVKEYFPKLTDAEVESRAKGFLFMIAELLGLGVVRRISYAIGSPELTQTYARMVEENNMPSVQLIDVSLKLDNLNSFPEGAVSRLARDLRTGSFARLILQDLILGHFYLFPVKSDVKQKMCAALGVDYCPVGVGSRIKLLPDSASS